MADGAYRWQGNAPAPDAARVDAIHAAYDDAQAAAFAEPARLAAMDTLERALAAARSGDLSGTAARLAEARVVLADLRPETLEPRRGLAGLFDSRSGRLKRFREAWGEAVAALERIAADLSEGVAGAAQRSKALDGAWADLRDTLVDLDAHLAAAARRLTGLTADEAAPDPLPARIATLDACRAAALGALPLVRNAQGADARAAEALKTCTDGVAAWRDDWKDALGLSGKRPRRVRPDRDRLLRARDALLDRIDRAVAELDAGRLRRAGTEARLDGLRQAL